MPATRAIFSTAAGALHALQGKRIAQEAQDKCTNLLKRLPFLV